MGAQVRLSPRGAELLSHAQQECSSTSIRIPLFISSLICKNMFPQSTSPAPVSLGLLLILIKLVLMALIEASM